ncbi:MAG: thioesterase family protein [Actinomycetota bacterium]|nr:thioesterase family protein [Acidimicrobiia bacterium]MDQ3294837.1 thioesterase family protein [Actinomycetota bacterium]
MLRTTHRSTVTEEQIDHLGHMNVRYYATNALRGTRAVLADLPGWGDRPHLVHDAYTRHHREQLLGTELVVRSLVLGADERAVRIHHELADAATGTFAATFVHRVSPVDEGGGRLPVPEAAAAAAVAEAGELPDHAATRTISLDADLLSSAPDLATLRSRDLAFRKPRTVLPSECDAEGRYLVELAPALTWGGEQVDGDRPDHLHETTSGQLMGWASMETRAIFGALPRVGEHIQSFAATVAVLDKVIHRVNWAYDLETGALLTVLESVSLAFDIRGRKPMSIPDGYRRIEETRLQPDLTPAALA